MRVGLAAFLLVLVAVAPTAAAPADERESNARRPSESGAFREDFRGTRLNASRWTQWWGVATVGAVSNPDHGNINIGKAGRNRWLGKKPSVRGVVMNPVDHPHGGGEGRSSGGRHPVTPWGKPTKGKKTRNNKRTDKFIARSRHARKK